MSEWDFEEADKEKTGTDRSVTSGKWDVALTIVTFVSVALVSFLTAWLVKDVPSRPFWMLGICFAAPVTALLLSAYLKEKVSPSMTPTTSRNAQLALVCCSILIAAVVGCFCQVTNEKADTVEQVVVGDGWSDLLIILDKSGSMSIDSTTENLTLNDVATEAVVDLVGQMDESARVGLLIDVGWKENNTWGDIIPLNEREIPIEPLTPAHRRELTQMARCSLGVNENFPRAFQVACDLVREYDGQDGALSIVIISDGADCTDEFRAIDFSGQLSSRGVKVYYLYVAPDYSTEMERLTELTGGESLFVKDHKVLLEQMKRMITVPVTRTIYKDALRDINESVPAKWVTGSLLGLLGVLIGFSLMVMFSLQGQKRFQLILSPLMAILGFVILAFGKEVITVSWIREGLAFSLFGIVLMRANRNAGHMPKGRPVQETVPADPLPDSSDTEW